MGNVQNKEGYGGNPDDNPYVKKIIEARQKLTGWERMKLVFTVNEYGDISPELQRVITGSTLGLVTGALIGAMGRGRIAYQDFMRSNMHEVFETPLQAKRKLQDRVTLGMGSGAYRVGWRMGLFTGMFLAVSTAVATYRGKMGIMDQVIGGGTAGFLYKFAHGPKASVAGGGIGSLLGLFAGVLTYGLTKLTGQTIDSANLQYYKYLAKKEEKQLQSLHKQRDIANVIDRDPENIYAMTQFHDKLIASLNASMEPDEDDSAKTTSQKQEVSQNEVKQVNTNENVQTDVNKSNSSSVANAAKR